MSGRGIVTVDLAGHPPKAPLGMLLAPGAGGGGGTSSSPSSPPTSSNVILVAGWEHDFRGGGGGDDDRGGGRHRRRLGPVQRSGAVRLGDRLWSRNANCHPIAPPYSSDAAFLGLIGHRDDPSSAARPVHANRRYSFVSYIDRWRVFDGPPSPGDDDWDDGRQRPRRHDIDDPRGRRPSTTEVVSDGTERPRRPNVKSPHVRYEIRCHILFRDPTSSFRSSRPDNNGGGHDNDVRRTWSVWRRYSELLDLDRELRSVFGWQMDATNDGRGMPFPSPRGMESWWHGLGVGGALSSLMSPFGTSASTQTTGENATTPRARGDEDDAGGDAGSPHPSPGVGCRFPPSFVDRRRRELAAYWTDLMRIEDIFDFGDLEFGKTMAAFLEVDDEVLLMVRKGSGGFGSACTPATPPPPPQQQQQLPSSLATTSTNITSLFPAIHEHETEVFPGIVVGSALDPSPLPFAARESSGLISSLSLANAITRETSGIADDDVSILSDGTGAFHGDVRASSRGAIHRGFGPVMGGRPVVDVVPAHYDDMGVSAALPAVEEGGDAMQHSTLSQEQNRSSYVNNSNRSQGGSSRRSIGTPPPRAKPAFQRQYL
ncbi:hypothetical protein ACHAW5_002051 [Stephanodiscus triporus]|uniref:PX domain-containing protein n=1 Tax=Stephanodiscus triporus TaxID=2934178 RepID=A0ABD3QKX9_9STRA